MVYQMTVFESLVTWLPKKYLSTKLSNKWDEEEVLKITNEFCISFCSECAGPQRWKSIKMSQHGTDTSRFLQVSYCRYFGGSYILRWAVSRWWRHTSCGWWERGRVPRRVAKLRHAKTLHCHVTAAVHVCSNQCLVWSQESDCEFLQLPLSGLNRSAWWITARDRDDPFSSSSITSLK